MDGAIVNNTPISHAVAKGATTVWVLCAGYACALTEPPRGALAVGLHALSLLLHQQLADDVERYEPLVKLHILPPLCPLDTSPADFSKAGTLIERGYRQSAEWIAEAPSVCSTTGFCRTVGLANFGSVTFSRIAALGNGAGGTLKGPGWQATAIQLVPRARGRFFGDVNAVASSTAGATPSASTTDGSSFSVSYVPTATATG